MLRVNVQVLDKQHAQMDNLSACDCHCVKMSKLRHSICLVALAGGRCACQTPNVLETLDG